ncbi:MULTISPECIES: hypothetical protein [Galbibacter]|uniref:Uncharacterized protein n=1 Tax=Galbibacter pacificus TaxID=2996052 RepID=A0ABT6FTJ3_9FLAO|nr:hypothetical protein [Galbibacter pacificus]MDG3583113.1 hypothetical protein [Galbibacter pacificus]MDG3586594.1 hypothetical protein [Galbibacter pacificus]
MKMTFENSGELLIKASEENLYQNLIIQLNKDLKFANLDDEFEVSIPAEKLKRDLHELVFLLINEKFADYLNLLYIIDVPETKVKALDGNNVVKLSEDVAFLILKREWEKVWFKKKYS